MIYLPIAKKFLMESGKWKVERGEGRVRNVLVEIHSSIEE
jgi:hypothetical protein